MKLPALYYWLEHISTVGQPFPLQLSSDPKDRWYQDLFSCIICGMKWLEQALITQYADLLRGSDQRGSWSRNVAVDVSALSVRGSDSLRTTFTCSTLMLHTHVWSSVSTVISALCIHACSQAFMPWSLDLCVYNWYLIAINQVLHGRLCLEFCTVCNLWYFPTMSLRKQAARGSGPVLRGVQRESPLTLIEGMFAYNT